ncbi:phosphatidylserine decarboxylase [bacterium]|nr:phosphatidylserine decarboxylase [bacterium]MBU1994321.1 phosphatidylserine decarboxylase [bacterium]
MKKHITSAISQNFGKFASKEFPKWFQKIVNNSYVSLMGLDMSEFHSADTYSSLNALFTRRLREDRKYSLDADHFISPCDSFISECGKLDEDYALQIKGMQYKCNELLGNHFSDDEKHSIHNGEFINLYLSPKDYHRYHIPTNTKILKAVHIPGKLYPVNMPSLHKRVNLFIENERVVIMCETPSKKKFFMVLVGALNVGVMQVSFEAKIKTNADSLTSTEYTYANLYLNKGDDFGCFEMGSTIVILAEKEMLELDVKSGDNVKYGDKIASIL